MNNKHRWTITLQIGIPLMIYLALLLILTVNMMFLIYVRKATDEIAIKSTQIAHFAKSRSKEYLAIVPLTKFWLERRDDMEINYDDDTKKSRKESILLKRLPWYTEAKYVTDEQFAEMDDETKLAFAEVCYAELSRVFDLTVQSYHCSLFCSFVTDGEECTYLLSGSEKDQPHKTRDGDIAELGTKVPYVPNRYPILDDIVNGTYADSPNATDNIHLLMIEENIELILFDPVYDSDGELSMIIAVANDVRYVFSEAIDDTIKITFLLILLLLVIILIIHRLITKNVVRPIKKEENILAEYIDKKDPDKTVAVLSEIKTNNEIESLAESFSYMTTELHKYITEVREVTAEKERISAELDMAAKIQASQLPSTFPAFPDRTEFDIFASMNPAKEIGGDFYDFFLIDDDHLALVIADVSGKGIPAALFMMSSKNLIGSYALSADTPSGILSAVNDHICEKNADNMFVTVWLGILEISSGTLTCCNAGHEYPAIKKAGGRFEKFNDKHGLFIGSIPGVPYMDYEIKLEKGDTLFVYTDGVPEATNAELKLFGEERMLDALNSHGDDTLDGLLRTVRAHIDTFVGSAPQFDDLTMLAIRYNGNATGHE